MYTVSGPTGSKTPPLTTPSYSTPLYTFHFKLAGAIASPTSNCPSDKTRAERDSKKAERKGQG
ncbi:hypothetical protein E2C01_026794 [Portunus trituberculatus]|uniref:Uncharacterized protein n=1 Tax=Portunus trituberculatus TaxID=210409 RepID=A0A5B7ELZ6_PORTR|nr:hypothetical protein [Portunus trituberculatus]